MNRKALSPMIITVFSCLFSTVISHIPRPRYRFGVGYLALSLLALTAQPTRANLFVSSWYSNQVLEYDSTTSAFDIAFASGNGLSRPEGLVFGPNGKLFVSGFNSNNVLEYNGTTGAFVATFVGSGSGGRSPEGV